MGEYIRNGPQAQAGKTQDFQGVGQGDIGSIIGSLFGSQEGMRRFDSGGMEPQQGMPQQPAPNMGQEQMGEAIAPGPATYPKMPQQMPGGMIPGNRTPANNLPMGMNTWSRPSR